MYLNQWTEDISGLINRMGSSESFLTKEFMSGYNENEMFEIFAKEFNHPDTLSYFNKMTHFDMIASLPGLLQVEDRVSMAVSIESRVPLLDRRIVDLISTYACRNEVQRR